MMTTMGTVVAVVTAMAMTLLQRQTRPCLTHTVSHTDSQSQSTTQTEAAPTPTPPTLTQRLTRCIGMVLPFGWRSVSGWPLLLTFFLLTFAQCSA